MLICLFGLTVLLTGFLAEFPTYQPGDPSYYATFAGVLIFVIVVLGLSLALALKNPRMSRTKKEY